MAQTPNKKRIIVYIIIFAIIAFLIVFFTGKRSSKSLPENITGMGMMSEPHYDMEDPMPLPTIGSELDTTTRKSTNSQTTEEITPITPTEDVLIDTPEKQDKKVIKTGTIDMHVNSVEKAIREIKTIAEIHGGDEISSDFSKSDTYKNGYIIIKVPVNQYAQTFEKIKNIAPLVTRESSQAQDVTAQFIDLESRIKNKKEHEDRLRTFFDKADDVDELIQIERELARVRTEVEQMEGQLKYLKDQTQYSTIHVTLLEDTNIVVSDSWRPLQVMKDSFNTLIQKSTNLINATIRFTITSLPFIILFIIISWFLYFTAKHIFKKDDKKEKN